MTLKKQLGRSTAWMSAAATGNSIASFIIFIILSRLLEPKEIGLVAFALIIVEIGKIIVNAGFPQAIVKHAVWDETYASTCFYLNMVFALSVTLLIFFVGSPLVGRFYEIEAIPILQVLSAIFFIDGIKAVHEGKLKREFNFRVIALRTIFAGVFSGMIGIFMAFKGFGVWALVGQQLINQCIITVFTLASAKWVPKLSFSKADAKNLLGFSSPLMLAQLINNINSKIFEILVGILVGPAALGFYRVGGRALFILQEIVIKPFDYTLLSAISRISEKAAQAHATLRVIRMSSYLTFPIFFGAAAIGPEFIIFAFGEKWALSGQVMTLLALGIAPVVINYQIDAALTASSNSKMIMTQASINLFINVILGLLIIPFGLLFTAAAYSARAYVTIFFNLLFFKRAFDVKVFHTLKVVASPFIASCIMFGTIFFAKGFLPPEIPTIVRLIILCLIGGLAYFILMVAIFRGDTRNFLKESESIVPNKVKPVVAGIQQLTRLT